MHVHWRAHTSTHTHTHMHACTHAYKHTYTHACTHYSHHSPPSCQIKEHISTLPIYTNTLSQIYTHKQNSQTITHKSPTPPFPLPSPLHKHFCSVWVITGASMERRVKPHDGRQSFRNLYLTGSHWHHHASSTFCSSPDHPQLCTRSLLYDRLCLR